MPGLTLEIDGVPVRLLEFLHVKPGKGSAFVRSKIKNLVNGSVQERTFRAGESVNSADVTKGEMQYTFTEGDNLCFMNMETFEEQRIPMDKVDNPLLLKAGLSCQVSIWNEQVIDVQVCVREREWVCCRLGYLHRRHLSCLSRPIPLPPSPAAAATSGV